MKIEAKNIVPSVRLKFVSFKKKTNATMLRDFKPGDILRIEFVFNDNRYGEPSRVRLVNETQGTEEMKSARITYGVLTVMNLEEVCADERS